MRPLSLAAVVLFVAASAEAFCGFYVSGAGGKLFNDASMVVLVRDGTRTVLSMQNNYRGPIEDFALVVPVPVVLQKGNVTTLPREAFTRLDELTAPRLVEMSTDQCLGGIGAMGRGFGSGMADLAGAGGLPRDLGVRVEAKFDVEEYEVVILSAQDSLGLEIWLKEEKYKIPDGAAALLKPYVQAGSKFFVAKVNPKKVKHGAAVGERFRAQPGTEASDAGLANRPPEQGGLVLSPLRFHYDSESFTLPVRLGLVNSAGTQDLIVHVIAKSRYELANAKNVLIPTNFDVRTRTQPQWGGFYAELLARTFKKHPGAAVTEFAWEGALPPPTEMQGGGIYGVTCDPCPPPHPVDNPLAKYLGVNQLPKVKSDESIAAFARAATVTRLHLRWTKENPPDDLVFKAVEPISGGVPEAKAPGPAKHNRFQGRYVMWIQGCGGGGLGGFGGLGFFSGGSPLNKPLAGSAEKLVDPFEQLIVADLPELDVKAVPLSPDAGHITYVPMAQRPPPPPPLPAQPVKLGTISVSGGKLEPEIVRRVVRQRLPQLRYCYDTRRNQNPALQGKVVLQWVINAEGNVEKAEATASTHADAALDACLVGRVKGMQFPKPEGPVTVMLPLSLSPQ